MRAREYLSAAAALAALVTTPSFAATQNQERLDTQPPGQTQSSAISEDKLDAEAAAMQRVHRIQSDYQQQVAAAQPSDKQRIMDQANAQAEQAVKEQGLSVNEYQSILQVAQNDPVVRQKLVTRLNAGP